MRYRILGNGEGEVDAKNIKEAMKKLGIIYEEYIPVVNGEPVVPEEKADEVLFVPVKYLYGIT